MDSYQKFVSSEAVVIFYCTKITEEKEVFQVIDSRKGNQWLPKKSTVLAVLDFEHSVVVSLGGNGTYYRYDEQHTHCYVPIGTLEDFIDYLKSDESSIHPTL